MAELKFDTPQGTLFVQGWQQDTMKLAAEVGRELAQSTESVGLFRDFDGTRVYVKGSHLRGKARFRYALRRLLLRKRAPRIEEYFNLCWLTERHFQVALPLAAGEFVRAGAPHYHYLITRAEPGALALDDFCRDASADERRVVLNELARELARMHSIRFLHHDLYPRNLLVASKELARRIVFIDVWAGGPAPNQRPPEYDLACLLLDADRFLGREEQRALLEEYMHQRRVQDRPVDARRFLARIGRERKTLFAQLQRHPGRLRGLPLPRADWDPEQLGVSALN